MKCHKSFLVLMIGMLLAPALGAQTVLRTEFQDTQPKFIRNADGSFGGLCLEIMALIEARSEFRFKHPGIFVPISRITNDLATSQIDVYFGLVRSPQREKDFLFISQLFDTQYQILARKDDPALAFTRLEQLQAAGIPLMVIKGSGSAIYFQGLPGLSYLDAPLSVDAAMQQLKAGRGRLFAYYDLGNDWFLDQLGYRDSLAALGVKFDKDTQWLCVSKSLPAAQAARLGETVDALRKTPEWASLMKRYHL